MSERADVKQEKQIKQSVFGANAVDGNCKDAIDYYYELIEADIMNENLVDGAWLRCEKATGRSIEIEGYRFQTNINGKSKLKVKRKNMVGEQAKAITID